MEQRREAAGTPSGGQFAGTQHDESEVALNWWPEMDPLDIDPDPDLDLDTEEEARGTQGQQDPIDAESDDGGGQDGEPSDEGWDEDDGWDPEEPELSGDEEGWSGDEQGDEPVRAPLGSGPVPDPPPRSYVLPSDLQPELPEADRPRPERPSARSVEAGRRSRLGGFYGAYRAITKPFRNLFRWAFEGWMSS